MTKIIWPLMHNNITRSDLDKMIEYLQQDDPKLTHGPLVKKFEEEWNPNDWQGRSKYQVDRNNTVMGYGITIGLITLLILAQPLSVHTL